MKKHIALLTLALIAGASHAADNLYGGVDIADSKAKAAGDTLKRTGFGAFVGYQIDDTFAVEGAYRRIGKLSDADGSVSINALQVSGLAHVLKVENFSFYGRLGLTQNALDVNLKDGGQTYSTSVTKWKPLVGIGASYAITKDISVRAEYNDLGSTRFATGAEPIKITQFNIGAAVKF